MASTPHTSGDLLLAECAAEARRAAPQLCIPDGETGDSCAWYHGFWPYLRVLGIVTTPTTHRSFYRETLGALAAQGDFGRVLISGSADFNMLERVFDAYAVTSCEPQITFLDRCPTPGALAAWYAERNGRPVTTISENILTFDGGPFDLICTHSFLGYFSDEERQALVRKWAVLLRPGGKVVTINRVRPGQSEPLGFTPEQAAAFTEKARLAAESCPVPLDLTVDEIATMARRYADRFRIRPISSMEDLRHLFERNGFSIDRMDGDAVPGHSGRKGMGPTTPEGATYVQIVASRL